MKTTINKGFLYYRKYDNFKRDLDSGIIEGEPIVFIEDSNIIWAHKHEFACECDPYFFEFVKKTIKDLQDSIENLYKRINSLTDESWVFGDTFPATFSSYSYIQKTIEELKLLLSEKVDLSDIIEIKSSIELLRNDLYKNSNDTDKRLQQHDDKLYEHDYSLENLNKLIEQKQDKLIAGNGIEIIDNTINCTVENVSNIYEEIQDITEKINQLQQTINSYDFSLYLTQSDIETLQNWVTNNFYSKLESPLNKEKQTYIASASGTLSLDGSVYKLATITCTGDIENVTLSSNPEKGEELTVIFYSNENRTVTINKLENIIFPDGSNKIVLTVPVDGYAEINFLSNGLNVYVRGV